MRTCSIAQSSFAIFLAVFFIPIHHQTVFAGEINVSVPMTAEVLVPVDLKAKAGPDQNVTDSHVFLNGSASTGMAGSPLVYLWTFLSRPNNSNAILSNPSLANPTFIADQEGEYQLQLIVSYESVFSAPDAISVRYQHVTQPAAIVPMGISTPIFDKDGNPGYVTQACFSDKDQSQLMTGLIGPVGAINQGGSEPYYNNFRPATSIDQGSTWVVHDSPNFAFEQLNYRPKVAARSPINSNRIWFGSASFYYLRFPQYPYANYVGGLWRSDDGGNSWSQNLAETGREANKLTTSILLDNDHPDTIILSRGVRGGGSTGDGSSGDVQISTDAGSHFRTLYGCTSCADSPVAADFEAGLVLIAAPEPKLVPMDGSSVRNIVISGGLSRGWNQVETSVKGLGNRSGGMAGHFTANGGFLYLGDAFYYAEEGLAGISSSHQIFGVSPNSYQIILTHDMEPGHWFLQTGPTTFSLTENFGLSWNNYTIPDLTGIDDSSLISAAYVPDGSGSIILFAANGLRFKFIRSR